jgi:chemotaxis protein methyltransferase CheR
VRIWSAGSCSGEEPYTISILWKIRVAEQTASLPELQIVATDFKKTLIARAEEGEYPESSLQDLPEELAEKAFDQQNDRYKLNDEFKKPVTFLRQDIRQQMPGGPFSMILCRNLVFTYFTADIQTELLKQMVSKLRPAGYFIIGEHEALPDETGLEQHPESPCIFQKYQT